MDIQPNQCVQHLLGSPCKIQKNEIEIFGRYIGDSNLPSSRHSVIIVGTPCNSIIHAGKSEVCFDLTRSDLNNLKDFEEDAISRDEWYHSNRDEKSLNNIGKFISPTDIVAITLNDDL